MSKGRVFHKIAIVLKNGDPVTVEQFNIGFRVIDTPGIPNMN